MLVSNENCYNLASQKKSITYTFNGKTTFFRHKIQNGTFEILPILRTKT